MPRELKGNFYYLFVNTRYLFLIFWAILLSLIATSLFLNVFVFKEGTIISQLSFPLYAVCTVIGIQMTKNNIPYLIKMGSTRKGVFKCVGVHFLGFAFVNAVLASTIYSLSEFFFGSKSGQERTFTLSESGQEMISFSHFADLIGNTWTSRMIVDLSIMFFLLVCGFVIGLIFYKYGTVIGISFLAVIIFTFMIGMAQGWLVNFFVNVFNNLSLVSFLKIIIISSLIYLLSYFLLRRLSIT